MANSYSPNRNSHSRIINWEHNPKTSAIVHLFGHIPMILVKAPRIFFSRVCTRLWLEIVAVGYRPPPTTFATYQELLPFSIAEQIYHLQLYCWGEKYENFAYSCLISGPKVITMKYQCSGSCDPDWWGLATRVRVVLGTFSPQPTLLSLEEHCFRSFLTCHAEAGLVWRD